ncbi:bifunctional phosphopantothenoylcysteine decarboxylase/phosphopantothenate--cysteine ligase CoaBC [Acidobacteria bacterium AH-259-D05]|nr:bifunctional phosphopantothenoylcysteine decarboxylase/phosphopantothenate--cysteine ligase CoaBC [Acidobacteria bacterium AH-259-D05]
MKIILGVTGCIGAYKSAVILRLLQREGFQVLPVMTRSAQQFITPLTLEKLSGNKVVSDLFSDQTVEIEHIALARKSDLLLVAPATANIVAKFARGIADDFLSTLYLSTTTPVVIAPAMNVEMWHHTATQENLRILQERGVVIVQPGSGYLACGEEGEGRLGEPELVLEAVLNTLSREKSLLGKQVLVTAGPTIEDMDPVRFLSNRSSGKMGYAIAREAQVRGAQVVLVSGPTQLEAPEGVDRVLIRSAAEMAEAVFHHFTDSDMVVMAAAVSDFTPVTVSSEKIKKESLEPLIRLEKTTDILKTLRERKKEQFLVGFAAQSGEVRENALRKLREKGLDLIVGNDISQEDTGFGSDFNQVVLIDGEGVEEEIPKLPKTDLARILWDRIERAARVKKRDALGA